MRIAIRDTCFQMTDLQSVCNFLSYATLITGHVCSKYLLVVLSIIPFHAKNTLLDHSALMHYPFFTR